MHLKWSLFMNSLEEPSNQEMLFLGIPSIWTWVMEMADLNVLIERYFSPVRKSKNGWVGGCCQYTI